MKMLGAIKIFILQGVKDVEAGDPEHHANAEEENGDAADKRGNVRRRDGEPGGNRREAERSAEPEVADSGEATGERIAGKPCEDGQGEDDWPRVGVKQIKGGSGGEKEQHAEGDGDLASTALRHAGNAGTARCEG